MQAVSSHQNSAVPVTSLIEANCRCVRQCRTVLTSTPAHLYSQITSNSSSIGAHIRHIIERFNSFLDGIDAGEVNYDCRMRELALELTPAYAAKMLSAIEQKLHELRATNLGGLSVVETVDPDGFPLSVTSTLERELMGLVSHTTHHLAIIAMLMKGQGLSVDLEIGKAPSTIIYERGSCN